MSARIGQKIKFVAKNGLEKIGTITKITRMRTGWVAANIQIDNDSKKYWISVTDLDDINNQYVNGGSE